MKVKNTNTKCERCERPITGLDFQIISPLLVTQNRQFHSEYDYKSYHLCNRCFNDYVDFMYNIESVEPVKEKIK